jgi:hypothetical protein
MRGSLLDSPISDPGPDAQSRGLVLIGAVAALLVTGSLFAGYLVLVKRHQQQTLAAAQAQAPRSNESKGPAKAQVLVDDALLKGDQTVLGGTVRNISSENLSSLSVDLELIRRKDGGIQRTSVPVQPTQIAPQQEGRYALQLRSADYSSVRLVGLSSGTGSAALAYTSAPGQKRSPEKLESKTIIVNQPAHSKGGFLNTPDNPGRVP